MTVPASGVRQQSVWASVVSHDAQALRGWLLALGFTEDLLIPGNDRDTIHHCQLDWPEGGRVLLSSTGERPTPCRPGTSSLHVVTATPDAVMARARALEVMVVHELVDQTDYPSRDFTVADQTATTGRSPPSRARAPGAVVVAAVRRALHTPESGDGI